MAAQADDVKTNSSWNVFDSLSFSFIFVLALLLVACVGFMLSD